MERPGWDDYFLAIAQAVSLRADCTRRKVGAVIVRDHRIVSAGYNGSPAGMAGCLSDGACPRGRHYELTVEGTSYDPPACSCGLPWPCPESVPPMSSYDTGPGSCIAVHAEANAILYAGREACIGATIYVSCAPCEGCKRLVCAAGLSRILWPGMPGDLRTYRQHG